MPVWDYVSYVISHGSIINVVKTMHVGADVHPHPVYGLDLLAYRNIYIFCIVNLLINVDKLFHQ